VLHGAEWKNLAVVKFTYQQKSSMDHIFRNFCNRVRDGADVSCVSQFYWDSFDEKEFA